MSDHLFLPLEPYSELTRRQEAWLHDQGVDVTNVALDGRFYLRYPASLDERFTSASVYFRAALAWEIARGLDLRMPHLYGSPEHLLRLDPMLEALYQAEGLTYELCDTCGVHVPELIYATHSHLREAP